MEQRQDDTCKILVGPIIGKVTSHSVRILLETSHDCEMNISITGENKNKGKVLALSKHMKARTPTIFKFENLEESETYSLAYTPETIKHLNPEINELKSSFRTMPKTVDPKDFKFAVISCNSLNTYKTTQSQHSLWKNLSDRISEVDYVFHLGNQVYLDDDINFGNSENPLAVCQEMLKEVDRSEYSHYKEQVREKIREYYRSLWGQLYIANVLRNVPNLMIFSEHEIKESFGFYPKYDPNDITSFDFFFSQQARYVYYQYQRQLFSDVDFDDFSKITSEHHYHTLGQIGFFLMDSRACRTWLKVQGDEGGIGFQQRKDLEDCFNIKTGHFKSCQAIFILSPDPILFSSKKLLQSALLNKMTEEETLYQQWNSRQTHEQIQFLDMIRKYREDTKKQVALVSGDLSLGGVTDIFYQGNTIIRQISSSAICQKPNSKLEWFLKDVEDEAAHNLSDEYYFTHNNWLKENNYVFLEVTNKPMFRIWSRFVTKDSQEAEPKDKKSVSLNFKIEKKENCTCKCNIF
jgi:hypothetical protein